VRAAVDFRLYLITDRRQAAGGNLLEAVERALAGGVRAVQLREKDLGGRELLELARKMRALTSRYGAKLLINDRADIALAAGADGVHLGEASIAPEMPGPPGDGKAHRLLGAQRGAARRGGSRRGRFRRLRPVIHSVEGALRAAAGRRYAAAGVRLGTHPALRAGGVGAENIVEVTRRERTGAR
jgi:thiamine-phosphate pyrophosphorylase